MVRTSFLTSGAGGSGSDGAADAGRCDCDFLAGPTPY